MSKVAKKRKTEPTITPIESEDKKGLDLVPPQDHPLSMPRGSRVCRRRPRIAPANFDLFFENHVDKVYEKPRGPARRFRKTAWTGTW